MKCIWNMPKPKVAPVSRASRSTTSSRRLSRMSAARRKIPWRTAGGVAAHAGNASAAASIARRASSRVPAAARTTVSPVNGSATSKVAPPLEATHSPPTKLSASRRVVAVSADCVMVSLLSKGSGSTHEAGRPRWSRRPGVAGCSVMLRVSASPDARLPRACRHRPAAPVPRHGHTPRFQELPLMWSADERQCDAWSTCHGSLRGHLPGCQDRVPSSRTKSGVGRRISPECSIRQDSGLVSGTCQRRSDKRTDAGPGAACAAPAARAGRARRWRPRALTRRSGPDYGRTVTPRFARSRLQVTGATS